jgi:hypothetical protein
MNDKGYNLAVHVLGHHVEQVFSLYGVDHTLLAGVPGSAFTEALACVFPGARPRAAGPAWAGRRGGAGAGPRRLLAIAFQSEEQMKQQGDRGREFERMATFGNLVPDLWMEHATGAPVSAGPLLRATEAAVVGAAGRAAETPSR